MVPSDELEQVKQRLAWLARELDETRQVVLALEAQLQAPAAPTTPAPFQSAPAAEEPVPVLVAPPRPTAEPVPSPAASPSPEPVLFESSVRAEPPPLPASGQSVAHDTAAAAPSDGEGGEDVSGPPPPSPLRRTLERLHLWPPSDEANAEVRLGAWWATRLGTLFAVIGVVFFGVYLSVGTPPWIKLVELAAVAVAVTVFGWWIERRTPRFGQVVFAGGQALIFFTALAAYTVPAVKVLDSRSAAVAWQLAAAVWIGLSAWRRRAPVEATVAVLLGFVAAGFSLAGGLQLLAAGAALALAGTAVVWCRALGWSAPSIVALFGYWAVYGAIVGGLGFATTPLVPAWSWILVVMGYALFFWRDDPAGHRFPPAVRETIWFQNTSSSAAVAAGWLTAVVGFPASLDTFYVAAAVVLGLAAWRRRVVAGLGDVVGAVLIAKCSGAVTLAVISWTDGRTTEIALLVQAWVMLVANRRVRSQTLGAAATLVWVASFWYTLDSLQSAPRAQGSLEAAMAALYIAGAVAWLLEAGRSVRQARPELATTAVTLGAVVGGCLVVATAIQLTPLVWLPMRLVVGAAILVGVAVAWRQRAPALAGGIVLGLAHVAYWLQLGGVERTSGVGNAWVVLLPTLFAAFGLGRRVDREAGNASVRLVVGSWLAAAAAILTGTIATVRLLNAEWGVAFVVLVATGLACAAGFRPHRRWLWLATWALVVGLVTFVKADLPKEAVYGFGGGLWIWVGLAILARSARGAAQFALECALPWPQRTIVTVGLVWLVCAILEGLAGDSGIVLPSTLALLALGLFNVSWVGAFRGAAWALWGWVLVLLLGPGAEWPAPWVAGTVVLAWIPVLAWGAWPALLEPSRLRGLRVDATLTTQAWLAAALAVVGLTFTLDGATQTWALVALTVATGALARWRIRPLVQVTRALLAVAAAAAVHGLSGSDRTWNEDAWAAVAVAVAGGLLPFALPWERTARLVGTSVSASAGLALFFAVAVWQEGAVEPFITMLWGLGALVWFALGLVGRSQPHRLLGLLALLLCIPRVFVVDLQSTLHRILAFAALGVVLLWIGFSYHRFRRWITEDPASEPSEGKG